MLKQSNPIQSNNHVLSVDKICLLANDVLRTTAKEYDFSNCFKLIPNMETRSICGLAGNGFDTGRGYFCRANMDSNKASTLDSCLRNLPMINTSKMAYNNRALEIMREALVKGLDAIPYAGKILAATSNVILGPTADEMILNEYNGEEFNAKLVALKGIQDQVLDESSKLAKSYIKDNFSDIIKSVKKML
ncbi:hypothetical protein K502DRAFT_127480 [Neoconidiobolus thromboides FSU 785]|nr:hypothetical protein K502DRAFT_127480 [Neoconidiobolus thromboides FSU 785]